MHHRREYAGREYSPRFFYKEVRDRHCGKRQCAAAQRKQQSRDIARYKRRQKYPCNKYQCGIICFPPTAEIQREKNREVRKTYSEARYWDNRRYHSLDNIQRKRHYRKKRRENCFFNCHSCILPVLLQHG